MDADTFRALARSSPWRWRTVSFTCSWRGSHSGEPVRAWIQRPGRMRVERLDGTLLQEGDDGAPQQFSFGWRDSSSGGSGASFGWLAAPVTMLANEQGPASARAAAAAVPPPPEPRLRPDGLVAERRDYLFDYDAPMYQNYHWVAMLDPRELTDGTDPDAADPALLHPDGTRIESVREVDHHGRPAWEAVLAPTTAYEPRCSCCPLLPSEQADLLEFGAAGRRQDGGYASAFRVRLDVGTGICVLTDQLDGPRAGDGHEVRIEAVDQPIPAAGARAGAPERPGRG